MIAVYYCDDSSPCKVVTVDNIFPDNYKDEESLVQFLAKEEYPWPSSEVIIIHNDKEIARLFLNQLKEKYFSSIRKMYA